MHSYRILQLTGGTRLPIAHVLAQYSGIVVDPRFHVLFGDGLRAEAGTWQVNSDASGVRGEDIRRQAAELEKRSAELHRFFESAGILVVYGHAPTRIAYREARMYTDAQVTLLDSHDWLVSRMTPPPRFLGLGQPFPFPATSSPGALPEPFLLAGSGDEMTVLDPGHPLANYLETTEGFVSRLRPDVRDWANVTPLAENRGGEIVCAEFSVGRGLALLVPPPTRTSEPLLLSALEEMLSGRLSIGGEWRLAAETELDDRWAEIQRARREEQEAIARQRADLFAVKARVFESTHVQRVIGYWSRIAREGTNAARVQDLYKLIEVLEDLYGGERSLPAELGVDAAGIKRVKRLANEEKYDLRHAGSEEPQAVRPPEVQEAIEVGRDLVQAFLERRYRQERSGPQKT